MTITKVALVVVLMISVCYRASGSTACSKSVSMTEFEKCILLEFATQCGVSNWRNHRENRFRWVNSTDHCSTRAHRVRTTKVSPSEYNCSTAVVTDPLTSTFLEPHRTNQLYGWFNVECDEEGRVVLLNLIANNLMCEIDKTNLHLLTRLRSAFLGHNPGITGDMASYLSNCDGEGSCTDYLPLNASPPKCCSLMQTISFPKTRLSGLLEPPVTWLPSDPNIARVQLAASKVVIQDGFPWDIWKSTLCILSLAEVQFQTPALTGPVQAPSCDTASQGLGPPREKFLCSICNLEQLWFLDLQYLDLGSVSIPSCWSRLAHTLQYLHLTSARTAGFTDPDTLLGFTKLVDVSLENSNSSLRMPRIDQMPHLTSFRAERANLFGIVPSNLAGNSKLNTLLLGRNPRLSINASAIVLHPHSVLSRLVISDLTILPEEPCTTLETLLARLLPVNQTLQSLYFMNTTICGPVPTALAGFSSLDGIGFGNNCGPLHCPNCYSITDFALMDLSVTNTSMYGCLPRIGSFLNFVSIKAESDNFRYNVPWVANDTVCGFNQPPPTQTDIENTCTLFRNDSTLYYSHDQTHRTTHNGVSLLCANPYLTFGASITLPDSYTYWQTCSCGNGFFGYYGICLPCGLVPSHCNETEPLVDIPIRPTVSKLVISAPFVISTNKLHVQPQKAPGVVKVELHDTEPLRYLNQSLGRCLVFDQMKQEQTSCSNVRIQCSLQCDESITSMKVPTFDYKKCFLLCDNNVCNSDVQMHVDTGCLYCNRSYYFLDQQCKQCPSKLPYILWLIFTGLLWAVPVGVTSLRTPLRGYILQYLTTAAYFAIALPILNIHVAYEGWILLALLETSYHLYQEMKKPEHTILTRNTGATFRVAKQARNQLSVIRTSIAVMTIPATISGADVYTFRRIVPYQCVNILNLEAIYKFLICTYGAFIVYCFFLYISSALVQKKDYQKHIMTEYDHMCSWLVLSLSEWSNVVYHTAVIDHAMLIQCVAVVLIVFLVAKSAQMSSKYTTIRRRLSADLMFFMAMLVCCAYRVTSNRKLLSDRVRNIARGLVFLSACVIMLVVFLASYPNGEPPYQMQFDLDDETVAGDGPGGPNQGQDVVPKPQQNKEQQKEPVAEQTEEQKTIHIPTGNSYGAVDDASDGSERKVPSETSNKDKTEPDDVAQDIEQAPSGTSTITTYTSHSDDGFQVSMDDNSTNESVNHVYLASLLCFAFIILQPITSSNEDFVKPISHVTWCVAGVVICVKLNYWQRLCNVFQNRPEIDDGP